MKKTFVKFISTLIAMLLLATALPFSATADTSGYYTYSIWGGEAEITDCDKSISGDITIPSTLGGYPVTSIGKGAFKDCSSLTSITIPSSVTSIGWNAFSGCFNLTSITIPGSVTSIGDGAFFNCISLNRINVESGNTEYCDINGVLFNKSCTTLIMYPVGKTETKYGIPDSVTSIGYRAFSRCDRLTSITVPDSVTSIGSGAFYNCSSLTSITIPDSVTSIDDYAFYDCGSLTSVKIGNSVTSIGYRAFYDCSCLTSVKIGNGVTSIGGDAFCYCSSLTSITIPNSVTNIGDYAFCYCSSLTSITIPSSVTSINSSAFYGCSSLTSVKIGNGVTGIGDRAFENCSSLTSITIPDSVTSIDWNAFSDCGSLTSVKIGNGVTSIGDGAFSDCSSLTSITIPDSVTSIGSYVFYGTAYYNNESNWENGVLYINNHLIKANSDLSGEYKIKDGICTIADDAFRGCSSLTSITIPDSVKSIGYGAFEDCSSLTNIKIGNGVTSIDYGAFRGCSSLTSIIIPDSVTSTGDWAFENCSSLTNVKIGNGVTSIGDGAFSDCSSLTSITIPDSVTSIDDWAFEDCSSLISVLYTGTAQQWKNINIGSNNDRLSDSQIISAPTVQLIGATKLVVKATEGYEYSIDGKVWQTDNLFTDLIPQSSYAVYARRTGSAETTVCLGASFITNGQDEVDTAPNSSNLVVLRKALISDFNNMALDYNADGEINILDFIRLKKYLCGMSVMLGNKETSVMSFTAVPRDTNTQSSKAPISEPYYSVAANINSEDIADRKID